MRDGRTRAGGTAFLSTHCPGKECSIGALGRVLRKQTDLGVVYGCRQKFVGMVTPTGIEFEVNRRLTSGESVLDGEHTWHCYSAMFANNAEQLKSQCPRTVQ